MFCLQLFWLELLQPGKGKIVEAWTSLTRSNCPNFQRFWKRPQGLGKDIVPAAMPWLQVNKKRKLWGSATTCNTRRANRAHLQWEYLEEQGGPDTPRGLAQHVAALEKTTPKAKAKLDDQAEEPFQVQLCQRKRPGKGFGKGPDPEDVAEILTALDEWEEVTEERPEEVAKDREEAKDNADFRRQAHPKLQSSLCTITRHLSLCSTCTPEPSRLYLAHISTMDGSRPKDFLAMETSTQISTPAGLTSSPTLGTT